MEPAAQPRPDSSGTPPLSAFLARHGAKMLALLPPAFLLGVILHFAVPVPFMDQWELVPLLEKSYQGGLTFHDLWAQHNEHRLLFPQGIMLALARLTGWDIRWELAVNLLLALGLFAVLARQVKSTERKSGLGGLPWAMPAISLVVFSVSQFQNWLWGWQLQMFLNLFAVVGGIVLLAHDTFSWRRFAAAAVLGIVATFSFANGALFWPIGLLILLVVTAGARERCPAIAGWLFIGALTMGTYFHDYHKPEEHPPLSLIFQMPLEYAAYVFKYLGGICAVGLTGDLAVDGPLACLCGFAGTAALGWAGSMLVRKRIANFRTLLPYYALSLYSVGSALVTGVGRLGYGSNQALFSRYCTMVTPLWVSLIVFLILLARGGRNDGGTAGSLKQRLVAPPWNCPAVARWSLRAAILLLVLGSIFAVPNAAVLSQQMAYGRARLLELGANPPADFDPNSLSALYPRPNVVVERNPVLVKYHLSVFRHPEPAR